MNVSYLCEEHLTSSKRKAWRRGESRGRTASSVGPCSDKADEATRHANLITFLPPLPLLPDPSSYCLYAACGLQPLAPPFAATSCLGVDLSSSACLDMATSHSNESLERCSVTDSGHTTSDPDREAESVEAHATLNSKVLRIRQDTLLQGEATLSRTLRPLHGTTPRDVPLEHEITYSCKDRRTLLPLTIRYRLCEENGDATISSSKLQNAVIAGIWARVEHLLAGHQAESLRPCIIFDEDYPDEGDVDDEEEGREEVIKVCVDVICCTPESFVAIRDGLTQIDVEVHDGTILTYRQHRWSNTLLKNILAIDILRLPVSEAHRADFFSSFEHMVAPVGKALGLGLVEYRIQQQLRYSGIARGYVKLSDDTMQLRLSDLIKQLPTRMVWRGSDFTLYYMGRDLHQVQESSEAYPLES